MILTGFSFIVGIFIALQMNLFYGTLVLASTGVPVFHYASYLFMNLPENVTFGFAIAVAALALYTAIYSFFTENTKGARVVTVITSLAQIAFCGIQILTHLNII